MKAFLFFAALFAAGSVAAQPIKIGELNSYKVFPAFLDPYNKNIYKGDYPIRGNDTFLVFTGISDTLAESRTVPTPSGVSAAEPGSIGFFGRDNQNLFAENVELSFDVFQGLTAFQPVKQRIKATLIANFNRVHVAEEGIVKPDVR